LFLILLLLPLDLIAAEFTLDGKMVVSVVTERTVSCGRYWILLKEERFPAEL
jgi:hypothetical protein